MLMSGQIIACGEERTLLATTKAQASYVYQTTDVLNKEHINAAKALVLTDADALVDVLLARVIHDINRDRDFQHGNAQDEQGKTKVVGFAGGDWGGCVSRYLVV
jgi:hypothetical protein